MRCPECFVVFASKSIQRQSYQLRHIEFHSRFGFTEGNVSYFFFLCMITCFDRSNVLVLIALYIKNESIARLWNVDANELFEYIEYIDIKPRICTCFRQFSNLLFWRFSRECSIENPNWNFLQRQIAFVCCAKFWYFQWRIFF